MGIVYVNGIYSPEEEAKISVTDRGFMLGDGLFETIRAYNGTPFRLSAHLDRLFEGLELIYITPRESKDDLASATMRLLKENSLSDAYIRMTITRGPDYSGLDIATKPLPTTVIATRKLHPYPDKLYGMGARVEFATFRANPTSPLGRIKSLNFLENIIARKQAKVNGCIDAIFLSPDENIVEGSVSNVFMVKDGILITPSIFENILPGITRAVVLELAASQNIKCEERPVPADDFLGADEIFLTNTLMEVMPVVKVNKTKIGDGRPGKITSALALAYKDLTQNEQE